MDIKAFSLSPDKYVSLGYAMPINFKIQSERFLAQKPKEVAHGRFKVYSEAKIDDIPADFQFNLVRVYIADSQIIDDTNLDVIGSEHGWLARFKKKRI